MHHMFQRLVTDSEIEQIRDAAMRILCREGVIIQNQELLEACERKGLKVDYPKQCVTVTPDIWRILEDRARASATGESSELISRRYGKYDKANQSEVIRRPIPSGMSLGRNISSFYDWPTGCKRPASLADNRQMTKALHMIPEATALGPLYVSQDVEQAIAPVMEPIVSVAEAFKLTDKPFSEVELMMPGQLRPIERLHSIRENREVRYHHYFASMTRFTLDARAAAILMEIHKENGIRLWGSNSVPILGLNCPITIAGGAAVAMAEMFGGWLPAWVLNEEIILNSVPVSASFDMKTSRILFSSPEAVLVDSVLFQIYNILYGMNVHTENSATYVDGKVPGFQAMHDKTYKSMAIFAFTGCAVGSHYGMLESGTSICPAQLMLDFDLNQNLFHTVHGFEVNADTLAQELIEEIGVHGNFIETEHTFEHFRNNWEPKLFDRTTYVGDKEEKRRETEVLTAAQSRYDTALASYVPPVIGIEKLRAYEEVVTDARKSLVTG